MSIFLRSEGYSYSDGQDRMFGSKLQNVGYESFCPLLEGVLFDQSNTFTSELLWNPISQIQENFLTAGTARDQQLSHLGTHTHISRSTETKIACL